MSITLLQLRTQARQRSDMEDSTFITDAELNSYINASIAELHDMMVQSYGEDYFVKSSTFNTVSGTDNYNLSSAITDNDFYKLRGIDAKIGQNDYYTLKKFNFNDRNKFKHDGIWNYLGITAVRYRIVGNKLYFTPTPDGTTEVRVWYIPKATILVADSDTLDDLNQFAEYVVVDTAIKMLNKEESDVTVLMNQKAMLKRRIEEVANNRDAGESESIQDIYSENNDFYYGRSN